MPDELDNFIASVPPASTAVAAPPAPAAAPDPGMDELDHFIASVPPATAAAAAPTVEPSADPGMGEMDPLDHFIASIPPAGAAPTPPPAQAATPDPGTMYGEAADWTRYRPYSDDARRVADEVYQQVDAAMPTATAQQKLAAFHQGLQQRGFVTSFNQPRPTEAMTDATLLFHHPPTADPQQAANQYFYQQDRQRHPEAYPAAADGNAPLVDAGAFRTPQSIDAEMQDAGLAREQASQAAARAQGRVPLSEMSPAQYAAQATEAAQNRANPRDEHSSAGEAGAWVQAGKDVAEDLGAVGMGLKRLAQTGRVYAGQAMGGDMRDPKFATWARRVREDAIAGDQAYQSMHPERDATSPYVRGAADAVGKLGLTALSGGSMAPAIFGGDAADQQYAHAIASLQPMVDAGQMTSAQARAIAERQADVMLAVGGLTSYLPGAGSGMQGAGLKAIAGKVLVKAFGGATQAGLENVARQSLNEAQFGQHVDEGQFVASTLIGGAVNVLFHVPEIVGAELKSRAGQAAAVDRIVQRYGLQPIDRPAVAQLVREGLATRDGQPPSDAYDAQVPDVARRILVAKYHGAAAAPTEFSPFDSGEVVRQPLTSLTDPTNQGATDGNAEQTPEAQRPGLQADERRPQGTDAGSAGPAAPPPGGNDAAADEGQIEPVGQPGRDELLNRPRSPALAPVAPRGAFSRGDLQERIKALYAQQGGNEAAGGVPLDVHRFAESLPQPWTFLRDGPYAGEVKSMLAEGEGGTAMARSGAIGFTDDPSQAGGEDAINAFRERYGGNGEDVYWQLARERGGQGAWQDTLASARASPDPELQLLAAIHDNLPDAAGRKPQQVVAGQDLPTWSQFELNGHQMRVEEDADGYRVLRDGDDYPVLPVDALPQVPMDKGTWRKTPEPDVPAIAGDDGSSSSSSSGGGGEPANPDDLRFMAEGGSVPGSNKRKPQPPSRAPAAGPAQAVADVVKPPTAREILFGRDSAAGRAAAGGLAMAKAGVELGQQVRDTVAPALRNRTARQAADALRDMMARNDQGNDRDAAQFQRAMDSFDRMTRQEQAAFHDAAERGQPQADPALQPISDQLHAYNDAWLERIRKLGTGKLQQAIEHYVGRIWQDPEAAQSIMAQIFAKKPLEGSKGFLKHRSYEYYLDGIAAGLKPVTHNPIEMMLMKGAEMRRYYEMQRVLQELQGGGKRKFVRLGGDAPENWRTVKDKAFEVWAPPSTTLREAFDSGLRDQLLAFAADNGISHARKVSLGRGHGSTWGVSREGQNDVITRFGGPDFVIAHEVGHALDDQYHFLDAIRGDRDPEMASKLRQQLNALADARFEHDDEASAKFRSYVRQDAEQAATVVQAYVSARHLFEQLAPDVLERFERFIADKPKLAGLADVQPTLTMGSANAEKSLAGPQLVGHYYVPGEVATLFDNMLAPGLLQRSGAMRGMFGANSLLNSLSLGMSAFHGTGTAIRSIATAGEQALVALSRGDARTAAGSAIAAAVAPVRDYLQGGKLIKAWYRPEGADPQVLRTLDGLAKGGYRPTMDRAFRLRALQEIARTWRQAQGAAREPTPMARPAAYANAALRTAMLAPQAAIQATTWPILEHVVPRLKAGAAHYLMAQEAARLPTGATVQQQRAAARRVVDMVDNRFGQLTYDNEFWPKWFKNVNHVLQRAPGWNLGTIREWGGAAVDTATMPRRIVESAKGTAAAENESLLTHRQANAIAQLGVLALAGGLAHYLMTGKQPEGKDWIYPQTGDLDENGHPVRLSLPADLKDVVGWGTHPLLTAKHKQSPVLSTLAGILSNKDYWGTQVRNEDDPLAEQAKDVGRFVLQQGVPFAYTSQQRLKQQGASPIKQAISYAGIQETSPQYSLTPAEQVARQVTADQRPEGGRTKFAAQHARDKGELQREVRGADPAQRAQVLRDAATAGRITPAEANRLGERSVRTPFDDQVMQFGIHDLLRVWSAANEDERAKLQPLLLKRLEGPDALSAARLDPRDAANLWEAVRGPLGDARVRDQLLKLVNDTDQLTPAQKLEQRRRLLAATARKAG